MRLSMEIKNYAVIGHPLGHTLSPYIHKRLFEISNINAAYDVIDVPDDCLEEFYNERLRFLNGFNVTIPHKQNVIKYLDTLDGKALMYGSVNTVLNKDGKSLGYTTDPAGFLSALNTAGIKLENNVVILGCGGVSRIMAYEALWKNCRLTLAVRKEDIQTGEILCAELKSNISGPAVSLCLMDDLHQDIDLLVNGTPVGMFPKTDAQPVNDSIISRSASVFDAVYNPVETVLVKKAKANGSRAASGIDMLVYQAAESQKIWNKTDFSDQDITAVLQETRNKLISGQW